MTPPTVRTLEGDLWLPGREWSLAVHDVARRFARVRMLDADHILALGSLVRQIDALHRWAGDDLDWTSDMTRYFNEHLSLHIKPDPSVTRSIRAVVSDHGKITVETALPESVAWSLLHHLGLARSVETIRQCHPAAG